MISKKEKDKLSAPQHFQVPPKNGILLKKKKEKKLFPNNKTFWK